MSMDPANDVAGSESEHKVLLDIGLEELAVDRPIEFTWSIDQVWRSAAMFGLTR
jgi:hypothetical protein